MRKQSLLISLSFLLTLSFLSCKKEDSINAGVFQGKWKTSYGDTILFSRVSGENMITYDFSMNPVLPVTNTAEYACENNKLGIKDGWATFSGFHFFQSFQWLDQAAHLNTGDRVVSFYLLHRYLFYIYQNSINPAAPYILPSISYSSFYLNFGQNSKAYG